MHPHNPTGTSNSPNSSPNSSLTNPRVPPNCRFELDDMERPWMWKENSFDFIFSRDLLLAIRDFPKVIDQCYTSVLSSAVLHTSQLIPQTAT